MPKVDAVTAICTCIGAIFGYLCFAYFGFETSLLILLFLALLGYIIVE